jgi:hypothetical protein
LLIVKSSSTVIASSKNIGISNFTDVESETDVESVKLKSVSTFCKKSSPIKIESDS